MTRDISLTDIMIASLVGLVAIVLVFNFYSGYSTLNNVPTTSQYAQYLQQLGNQYSGFGTLAKTTSNQSTLTSIFGTVQGIVSGTINVFVIGLEAIGNFFTLIPLFGSILSILTSAFPGLSLLLGLLTIMIPFYIGMRYRQSASNSPIQT